MPANNLPRFLRDRALALVATVFAICIGNVAIADNRTDKVCLATTEPCFLGIDPDVYHMPLTGQYVLSGTTKICATRSWNAFPPETFSLDFIRGFYSTLTPGQKAATETAAYGFITTHWAPPVAAPQDLGEVARPRDFVDESFRALDGRTTRVEFEVPKTDFEKLGWRPAYLPVTIPPDSAPQTPVKLRGWYIQGDGVSAGDSHHDRDEHDDHGYRDERGDHDRDDRRKDHPLFILSTGFPYGIAFDAPVGAIEVGAQIRRTITYLVANGYDVLIFDKRGHGYSQGFVDGKGEDIFRALDLLDKGVTVEEGITYNLSILTPEGRRLRGRAAAQAHLLGAGYSAKTKPVVLRGFSYGSSQLQKAMAMNYSGFPVELRYTRNAAGTIVVDPTRTPAGNRGYNFRGIVAISGFQGSLKYETAPFFSVLDAGAAQFGHTGSVLPSSVYESMRYWPAYLGLFGTNDFETADGAVDVYNNQLRGFKDIKLVTGYHFGLASEPVDGYFAMESVKFADQAVFERPPTTNTRTTTYAEAVCDAEPVTMDPGTQSITSVESRRIRAANREVDQTIAQWIRGENSRRH